MDKDAIDTLLQNATGGAGKGAGPSAGNLPGVVALAANRDSVIYQGAFGTRDTSAGTPMTLDTVFWIASMTKAICSVAALQQVEAGKLTLNGPISDVLPELKDVQVFEGFDAAHRPRLRPPSKPITLQHLLTHTAGYGYDIWNPELGKYMEANGIPGILASNKAALRLPLLFDPGTRWEYGINIDLIGQAVEVVTGQRLGAYLHAHLTGPLGMRDTAFKITPSMRNRLARMHARTPDGLTAIDFEILQEPEIELGGAGLYATLPDYLRFTRALLRGGELDGVRILSAEMAHRAMTDQITPVTVGKLATAMPHLSADAEFFPGVEKGWGLIGLTNNAPTPAGRSAGSIAWAGLANTYWWVDTTQDLCGVIGTQLLPFGDPAAIQVLERFEAALH